MKKNIMKKNLWLCLVLAMLLTLAACPVCAEEEPLYIRQLPPAGAYHQMLLTEESYPEIRLAVGTEKNIFGKANSGEMTFVRFPGPEGASACLFGIGEAHYQDGENRIKYAYLVATYTSFEKFLKKLDEKNILLDGAEGAAAYVDPNACTVYGQIAPRSWAKT